METPISKDSISYDRSSIIENISHLDISKSNLLTVPKPESPKFKIDLAQKGKNLLEANKKLNQIENSSVISNSPIIGFNEISDDVILLKQTLSNLITQISAKNKEKLKKKEQIKYLEILCSKNKKKIKKMKNLIQGHEEQIINLENKLSQHPGSLSDRAGLDKSNWKLLFLDKNLIPNISFQQKHVDLTLAGNKSNVSLSDKNLSPKAKNKKTVR